MQFEPFNPMSIYSPTPSQSTQNISLQFNSDESLSEMDSYQATEQSSTITSIRIASIKKSNASEYHNMTKQMVTTMKHIMAPYIKDLGSSINKRKTIRNVWEKITQKKNPTKSIIKLAFDPKTNPKLLKQEKLIDSINSFNDEEFREAMEELREELIMRMKESNIRSNLMDRAVAKKEVLLAYIQHFLHEQLEAGEIKARFGPSGSKKIRQTVNQTRKEVDFVSDCLF